MPETKPAWMTPPYGSTSISLGGLVTLTNIGASYDGTNAQRGLGFAEVDFTHVTNVKFTVMVNKIGTGTQDWQLWNETDGAQLGVISDAGGTGNKTLTTTINSGLPTGIKLVRVRAKGNGTDDPVYFGAMIRLW